MGAILVLHEVSRYVVEASRSSVEPLFAIYQTMMCLRPPVKATATERSILEAEKALANAGVTTHLRALTSCSSRTSS